MKRTIVIALLAIQIFCQAIALDHIIFRDGRELDVKLNQITNDKITFSNSGSRSVLQEEISTGDVYMVYLEKQGNIYLTPDGKRITGETKRVDPKKFDAIYLVSGAEIAAKDIRITEDAVQYCNTSNGGILSNLFASSGKDEICTIPKTEVFMIRYKSGMVDIITSVLPEPEEELQQPEEEDHQPQFIVIFHAVTKGDTLNSVAEKYNVSTDQIREWNDLSTKTKVNVPLTAGMQLMIYQPKEN